MAIHEESDHATNAAFSHKLLSGEPLHFQKGEPEVERTIKAAWIEQAAGKQLKIDLSNAVIVGSFKLKYAALEEEISLVDCCFKDPVDFSYATFKRNLVLAGSTFEQSAVFHGGSLEYDAQLIGTCFLAGKVDFSDLHAKGVFLADRLRIGIGVEEANFNRAYFEKTGLFLESRFEGAASFRGARFGDQAAFQGAQFQKVSFNGATIGQHALFRAEPRANIHRGALFHGEADFGGAEIGGQASFQGAVFKGLATFAGTQINGGVFFSAMPDQDVSGAICEAEADFTGVCVRGQAEFQGAVFKQKVTFSGATITGRASFNGGAGGKLSGASFEGEADFRRACIGGHADFRGALFKNRVSFDLVQLRGGASFSGNSGLNLAAVKFEGDVSFASARIGGQADFRGAVFERNISFNLAKLEGGAFFRRDSKLKLLGAIFGGEADFIQAHFDGPADFQGSVFKGKADFSGATVNGPALFHGEPGPALPAATFEGDVSFAGGQFQEAQFRCAVFKKLGRFSGAEIGGTADFSDAVFEGEADFGSAHFHRRVDFDRSEFRNSVSFSVAAFDGDAFFPQAVFKGDSEADFRGTRFGSVVDFQGAVFEGNADFYAARCESLARFEDAEFQKAVSFRGTSFTTLDFSANGWIGAKEERKQFQGDVDLLGCTYDHIQVDWQALMRRGEPYGRQPYTQLERVLRATGEDREADKVYLMRQHRERELKWKRGERSSWVFSALYGSLAHYGVRPIRLIVMAVALVSIGTIFFQLPEAVELKNEKSAALTSRPIRLSRREALGVSVHQFLPVDIPMGLKWTPADKPVEVRIPWVNEMSPWRLSPSIVATIFLRLAGWILVPCGVAALTGLLRARP